MEIGDVRKTLLAERFWDAPAYRLSAYNDIGPLDWGIGVDLHCPQCGGRAGYNEQYCQDCGLCLK